MRPTWRYHGNSRTIYTFLSPELLPHSILFAPITLPLPTLQLCSPLSLYYLLMLLLPSQPLYPYQLLPHYQLQYRLIHPLFLHRHIPPRCQLVPRLRTAWMDSISQAPNASIAKQVDTSLFQWRRVVSNFLLSVQCVRSVTTVALEPTVVFCAPKGSTRIINERIVYSAIVDST